MTSLQIRELPDALYQTLARRAEQANRSLAQQALTDLRDPLGGDPLPRRRLVLAVIRADLCQADQVSALDPPAIPPTAPPGAPPAAPEDLIRADRGR